MSAHRTRVNDVQLAERIMAQPAADHSLAFHRLQEARQELAQARSGFPAMPPRDRARLLAHCEANVAEMKRWLARTSGIDERSLPPQA
jgi:hypothetical protein